ncbi:hypothetical protein ACX9I7_22180 [Streptomyces sp. L500]
MTARLARPLPYATLAGFVLLLAVLFGVSYAAGSAAGPVAPGLHRVGGATTGSDGGSGGDDGNMGGMPGMGH